jgi:hypothetical protein
MEAARLQDSGRRIQCASLSPNSRIFGLAFQAWLRHMWHLGVLIQPVASARRAAVRR